MPRQRLACLPPSGTLLAMGMLRDITAPYSQVARARTRAGALAPRVRFVEGSALDLPLPAELFEAAISVASIKHWPDPALGLSECVRVLAPGGWLAVLEVDRGCSPEVAAEFVAGWSVPRVLRPAARRFFRAFVAGRSFDCADADRLLAPLGLEETSVERAPGTPAWLMLGRRPRG